MGYIELVVTDFIDTKIFWRFIENTTWESRWARRKDRVQWLSDEIKDFFLAEIIVDKKPLRF